MHFTDSHAHVYSEQFKPDQDDMLNRAYEAGVQTIVMPNIDHESIDVMLETEARFPQQCHAMMGLHPCHVTKNFERELYEVEDWLGRRPFAAVGECGIDLHWDKTALSMQQEALRVQIALAKKHQLPLVLHTREAFRETTDLIEAGQDGTLRGVYHCFSGTAAEAEEAIRLGFLLGIGGVVTFKNGGLDKVLPGIALEHLLLETDCPYLAPMPHRGKRNEPAYLPLIARRVATLLNKTEAEVVEATTHNARQLFKL